MEILMSQVQQVGWGYEIKIYRDNVVIDCQYIEMEDIKIHVELHNVDIQEAANHFGNLLLDKYRRPREVVIGYRSLLRRYIEHIGFNNGETYIKDQYKEDEFTDEEWAELVRLDVLSMMNEEETNEEREELERLDQLTHVDKGDS